MAEETPSNLGSMFGGFIAGRAAGNKRLDETADRLERTLDKFADTLQRLTTTLQGVQRSTAAPSGGSTQQSSTSMGNGGSVTFGGAHRPTSHRSDALEPKWTGGGGGGRHIGNGGGFTFGGGGNDGHNAGYLRSAAAGAYANAGGRAGIARKAAGAAVAGTAIYTANHYSNQVMGQSIAAQYSYGSNWSQQYRNMGQSYTAANDQDYFASSNMMAAQGGFGLGSGFGEMMSGARGLSYVDPTITNAQATQGILGLGSAGTFNRMAAIGINTMGRNGQINVNNVARQILGRMNAGGIRTPEQVEANFGPAGNATLTVQGMVQNGYIPPQSAQAVLASMRGMLKARVGGMGYKEYNRLMRTAGSNASGAAGDAARDRLAQVGIQNTLVQQQRAGEGLARDTEGNTIAGFAAGVSQATTALQNFRNLLNRMTSGPVGAALGYTSGISGTMPGISNIINRFTPGGDGPPSMAGSQMMYASAAGAPGGGMVMGSGPASMSSDRTQYASGAGLGRKGAPAMGGGIPRGFSLGGVKPWVAKAASILGPKFGIKSMGGVSGRGYASDHPKGLAVDFMCSKGQGDQLAAYAQANAASLNITYIIWYKRIWSVNRKSEGWRPYGSTPDGNTSPTALHMDHVHISFLASPTNGDFSNMSSGGGSAAAAGTAMSNAVGASSPGSGAAGGSMAMSAGFTEAGALGLTGGGVGLGQGSSAIGAGGMGAMAFGGGGSGSMGGTVGGAGDVRSGTYNLLHSTSNAQSKRDLLKLMSKSDVLSLTEWVGKKRNLAGWLRKQGWGVSQGPGDTANIYDLDDYERVRGGSRKLNTLTGSRGGTRERYAQYDLLRDKDTGMEFWQVGAHAVPLGKGRNNPLRKRIQKQQFAALEDLAGDLGGNVLIAGDFNNRRPGIGGHRSSSGRIDSVLYGGGASLTGSQVVGGLSSDHAAVLSQFAFGGGGNSAGLRGGGPAANMALARAMLQARGWSGQWSALKQLWMHESGFRTNADNPTSSAYGIPQALTAMHGLQGTNYMTDPRAQIKWGLNYIANRYGSPQAAWNFWQKNHWYDQGAWNLKEDHDARVHKGEMILPTKVAEAVRNELTAPGIRGGSSGAGIIFQPGAIQVNLQQGTPEEARKAGQSVVDAMMEDNRIKTLMGG